MKYAVTINKNEYSVDLTKGGGAAKQLREFVRAIGVDWRGAEIFVAHFPERGRHLQKSAGFEQLNAGG